MENLRNVLAITGDPISDASKVETKSVFNLNSFRLIELIKNMNRVNNRTLYTNRFIIMYRKFARIYEISGRFSE